MISYFDIVAILLTAAAVFAWINATFLKLPSNIAMLLMGITASVLLLIVELLFPHLEISNQAATTLKQIDFYDLLMHGMLGFLLFAGALHVDWQRLKSRSVIVGTMATVGVVISTACVGTGFWAISNLLGIELDLSWALVFGALISPTDPVAVLSTLRKTRVPDILETEMAGESLFNDGVGIVLFSVLLAAATSDGDSLTFFGGFEKFVQEALGGMALGLTAGYVAYRAMRTIDDYVAEILISLAVVSATYAIANSVEVSGAISVVAAGLLIGERGPADALSDTTQRYLFGFWQLVDEILNAVLFLLIGIELLVVSLDWSYGWLAAAAIPLVLFSRLLATAIPVLLIGWIAGARQNFVKGTIPVMVWGGVRGGIGVALALSIPYGHPRPVLLAATYIVVVFTVIVQGLTLEALVRRVVPNQGPQP